MTWHYAPVNQRCHDSLTGALTRVSRLDLVIVNVGSYPKTETTSMSGCGPACVVFLVVLVLAANEANGNVLVCSVQYLRVVLTSRIERSYLIGSHDLSD